MPKTKQKPVSEATIAKVAKETGKPFNDGGAYMSSRFKDWTGCVRYLFTLTSDPKRVEDFLRSKNMRWCSDNRARSGKATVADLKRYIAHWLSKPGSMGSGIVEILGIDVPNSPIPDAKAVTLEAAMNAGRLKAWDAFLQIAETARVIQETATRSPTDPAALAEVSRLVSILRMTTLVSEPTKPKRPARRR